MKAFLHKKIGLAAALLAGALGILPAQAAPAMFTGSYSQNFDLALTNGATAMPDGFRAMIVAGASGDYTAANPISAAAIAAATASGAQSLLVWNAGSAVADSSSALFNVGLLGNLNDRALGSDPSAVAAMVIELSLTNATGTNLPGVIFSYDLKVLTNGSTGTEAGELPGYSFFYSLTGGTTAAEWTRVAALSLTNFTQGTTMSSGAMAIAFPTSLSNNGILYFRWADDNSVSNSPDQMLAVDNIAITAAVLTNGNFGPAVSLTAPASNAIFSSGSSIVITANASETGGNITNVAFYSNSLLLGNATNTYTFIWQNVPAGTYALTAVASDASGISATSAVVNITIGNVPALQTLRQIKTVFVIALENHNLTQANPNGSPQQIFTNPAAPFLNSLVTPGSSNAAQVAYAARYFNVGQGVHPSEPNYIWSEAGTDFGIYTSSDPSVAAGNLFDAQHLTRQLNAAGVPWKDYQEDLEYIWTATVSVSGTNGVVNPYNGSTYYYYAVKHNPMEFFTDTQNQNVYPLTNFWTDLTNHAIGRYNWITPDQYNEMHSYLPDGFTYHGVLYTGDQAAIAEGDNCLSIIVPKIMASAAYQDHGVIILWYDEAEGGDTTNSALPEIIISPLAKGNAYASNVEMSHASDLKTMDEIFGLAFQTNAIPARDLNAAGTGYNYVATINDLGDLFGGIPFLSLLKSSGTNFQFAATGLLSGQTYLVLCSTDLVTWTPVSTNVCLGNSMIYSDQTVPAYRQRFYRLVQRQ